ncbi:MAG TPA: type II secretion system F family protein [Solirubrobacteraceae bacterium]|jgi:tight adherence protein B|nr:type II secretion system F family protein [Solirubrobacteraceae bacterium]
MSGAVAMAGLAGALGVLAAWEALAALDQRLAARALGRWFAPLRARGEPSAAERRRLAAVAAGALWAGGWLVAGPVPALALGAAGPWAANRALAMRRARRRAELAAAAPAVARALADALAGGHSVRGAIGAAATAGGLGGAAGAELRAAAGALDAGAVTDDVLDGLRRRAGDPGWDTLVAAILLQRDAGGDLAHLLRGLAERLEAARRADADARSLTAQARFTAWLVAALPAGAAVLAELGSPGYVASLMAEPVTAALVATSAVLQVAAVLAVRRVARVAG